MCLWREEPMAADEVSWPQIKPELHQTSRVNSHYVVSREGRHSSDSTHTIGHKINTIHSVQTRKGKQSGVFNKLQEK